ncbi:aminotransferase class V-fold PLP-dependent enzyme, partial [Salmonella enterica subsp. enterica serovar Infantis]
APDEKSIVWTRGTTEAINMVAHCYAPPRLRPGDEIIVSVAEHHANLVPWLMVAHQTGAQVIKLPLNERRLPDVERLPE